MAVRKPVTDPAQRIENLLAKQTTAIRKSFLAFVKQIRDERTLSQLADLLERGRIEEAMATIRTAAEKLGSAHNSAYTAAAEAAARVLEGSLTLTVGFDQVNERAVEYMRRERLRLIREIDASQRSAIRTALTEGIRRGDNPITQARNFRSALGLTETQARSVVNYRTALETLDGDALSRKLRDKRFDRTIAQAIRDQKPLTGSQIQTMTDRYYERAVKHRSNVIARTEALRAVHSGNNEMFQQAIDAGQLDPQELERKWTTARDSRVRDSHKDMNGQKRFGLTEPFTTPSGAQLRFPGDPMGPPGETIQCRCAIATRLKPLSP